MFFSKQIRREITINSSAEQVWSIITGFDEFPHWNPFIRRIIGDLKVGAKLEVFIQPSGTKGRTFKPKVLKVEPNHELRWLGRLYLPGLFDGEHALIIERTAENQVKFIQQENFSGVLIPLSGGILSDTLRGFDEMNLALKKRAEENQLK